MIIISILLTVIFIYLGIFIGYLFLFALSALVLKPRTQYSQQESLGKFLILIPSYKEDAVILNTALNASAHDYPKDKFQVCVIADKLRPDTLESLSQLPVEVLEVFYEKSTKAQSISTALAHFSGQGYDYVVILDADNIMEKGVLHKFNHALQSGYLAVQGHRTAKNRDTNFAVLDGLTEEINNRIFRLGHRALGLASGLIGSGMAFDFEFYKTISSGITVSWEDKEVEFRILKDNHTIEYLDNAYIYDEKVQNSGVYARQRSRWLAGQFHSVQHHASSALGALLKGNVNYFDKWFQHLVPPRMILLCVLPGMALVAFLLNLKPVWWAWLALLAGFVVTNLLAIPRGLYDKRLIGALFQLPSAIISMFVALLSVKQASKTFIHTPHSAVETIKK